MSWSILIWTATKIEKTTEFYPNKNMILPYITVFSEIHYADIIFNKNLPI